VSAGVGSKEQYWSGVVDIDDWLRAYRSEAGHYKEWPQSLAPSSLDPGYSDAAALGLAAVGAIRKTYASRQELIADHRKRHFAMDRADGLSLRTIAQNETDYWLGTLVARLARAQTLPSPAKGVLGKRLQDEFARYSRKKFGARINIADLQAYLSLPVWRKRHELYAVWIATEIVNALPDHVCQIHHEDGKIVFAFRETLLATVKSSWPIVRLISERRVPLDAPVGKGRSGNVQPDYGLWRHEAGVETCGLIIEVKHYKRSASSSFGHVLADYSRAFPKANVYLVNHGPIGDVRKDLPRELSVRCYPVKELTVPNLDARDELRKAVRKYVGEPVARPRRKSDVGKPSVGRPDTVLAIDVSSSMSGQLGKPHFFEIVQEVADEHCGDAALIDVSILAFVPLENLAEAITSTHGSSTGLGEPIRELLRTFKRVVVITDDDGLNSLRQISNRTTISRRLGLLAIEVLA